MIRLKTLDKQTILPERFFDTKLKTGLTSETLPQSFSDNGVERKYVVKCRTRGRLGCVRMLKPFSKTSSLSLSLSLSLSEVVDLKETTNDRQNRMSEPIRCCRVLQTLLNRCTENSSEQDMEPVIKNR